TVGRAAGQRIPARPGPAPEILAHGRDGGALRGGRSRGVGLPAQRVRAAATVSVRPTAAQVNDRALVLYALVRRASIEVVLAATEGRAGEDATLASISAERRRGLSWLRDRFAEPA